MAAARAAFAEKGTSAALDDIARRAGVGIGTLYRHFPNRDAAILAAVHDELDDLVERGADLVARHPPAGALAEWLAALAGHATIYRGLARTLATEPHDDAEMAALCAAVRATAARLVAGARDVGALRSDLDTNDVLDMVLAVATATESDADGTRRERLLGLVLDSFGTDRPAAVTPRRRRRA